MELKKDFLDSLTDIIPNEKVAGFVEAIFKPTHTFVRYNPFKEIKYSNQLNGINVQWCKLGIELDKRESFTTDPLFHGGVYYVQEASSMFIESIFENIIFPDKGKNIKVLDLCAAPGGKSTHISSLLGEDGLLVANEVIKTRASILEDNIIKWGIGNCVVTNNDPSHFGSLPSFFDVIVVDAPCSGEGMFRKSETARQEWSISNVELCRTRQQRILHDTWNCLAEDGYIVYSTCTFNRKENEDNVKWIIEELGAELVDDINLPLYDKVIKSDFGYRFHPDKVNSEGYFVAVLRKTSSSGRLSKKDRITPLSVVKNINISDILYSDNRTYVAVNFKDRVLALDKRFKNDIEIICSKLNVFTFGIEIGDIPGGKLRPAHGLALAVNLTNSVFPSYELDYNTALSYLRRNTIEPEDMAEGFNLIKYKGVAIGWIKRIGARTNNLYPKESRILNK